MQEWQISCYACGQVLQHHIMPILTVLQFHKEEKKCLQSSIITSVVQCKFREGFLKKKLFCN